MHIGAPTLLALGSNARGQKRCTRNRLGEALNLPDIKLPWFPHPHIHHVTKEQKVYHPHIYFASVRAKRKRETSKAKQDTCKNGNSASIPILSAAIST